MTQLFLYAFGYRALRNFRFYFIWIVIGLVHLGWYFQLKDNMDLINPGGPAARGFRNTLPLLILFQVLRFISIKTQGKELVAPARGATVDQYDGRKITMTDFFLFMIYLAVMVFGGIY